MYMSKHPKVVLVTFLSCFVLLLGLFISTGTVSAHTQHGSNVQNAQGDCCSYFHQPQITVITHQVKAVNGCANVIIAGQDFSPSFGWNSGWHGENFARIFAFDRFGDNFSVFSNQVLIGHSGDFFTSVSICGTFRFFQTHKVFVVAQDAATGHTSNGALFKLTNDAWFNPNA
jgi:hypothetical protein